MPLKILQIGKYYPPHWGGIETVTYNLNQVLDTKEFEVRTFVYGKPLNEDCLKSVERFKYHHVQRTPISFSMLISTIRRINEYDYVILHVPNPWSVLSVLLSGYKGKLIIYWHAESKGNKYLKYVADYFQDIALNRSEFIFGATHAHYKDIPNYDNLKGKCRKYSYPVSEDILKVSASNSDKSFDFSNGIRLLNVGRLVEYKGQKYLLEAMHRLVESGFDVYLDIVGSGPLYQDLISLIESLKLTRRVQILQNVSASHLESLLHDSHIFCFPSVSAQEMYGMAQIEAYAYGLPVVTTNIKQSGVGEVARSSGAALICEPRNAEDLVEKITTLIKSPDQLKEMSKNGKKYIRSFSNESKRKEFISLLDVC